jgi:hypothetical protein
MIAMREWEEKVVVNTYTYRQPSNIDVGVERLVLQERFVEALNAALELAVATSKWASLAHLFTALVIRESYPLALKAAEGLFYCEPASMSHLSSSDTALWVAVAARITGAVEHLLDLRLANVNCAPAVGTNRGKTALWIAACQGQWLLVERMLDLPTVDLHVTPEQGENRGKTVLWFAVAYDQWALADKILTLAAPRSHLLPAIIDHSPCQGFSAGVTAFWLAAYKNRWELVQRMIAMLPSLKLEVFPLFDKKFEGVTPLALALRAGALGAAAHLLLVGAQEPPNLYAKERALLHDLRERISWSFDCLTSAINHLIGSKGEEGDIYLSRDLTRKVAAEALRQHCPALLGVPAALMREKIIEGLKAKGLVNIDRLKGAINSLMNLLTVVLFWVCYLQ